MDSLPQSEISRELGPGERLLWSGRPRQGFIFRSFDALITVYFAIWPFVMYFLLKDTSRFILQIFVVVSVTAFIYVLILRFILDRWLRAHMLYAVTDKRIIIVYRLFGEKVKVIRPQDFEQVEFDDDFNGGGRVSFRDDRDKYDPGHFNSFWSRYKASWKAFPRRMGWLHGTDSLHHLVLDSDARHVFDLIRSITPTQ